MSRVSPVTTRHHPQVDEADPPYPRPAGYWWFGCKSQSSSLRSSGDGAGSFSQPRVDAGGDGDVGELLTGLPWRGAARRLCVRRC